MNTNALKSFAQQTRLKLVSLIGTKLHFVLAADTAELRGCEQEIARLRQAVDTFGHEKVVEEVAYTWFNRVMALRFMDANGYNLPMVVTPAAGTNRPEILQDAMAGSVDADLRLSAADLNLPEAKLYRRLLVAVCNSLGEKMPFLFEHITDYTELLLPDDLLSDQSFVADIRHGMSDEDCSNVEIIGWLYQFYITDRKADAEAKKSKKGGLKSDEQAAATQLFTPNWIVRYMVDNSLGRIWMTLHPDSRLIEDMKYYVPSPEGQADVIPEHIHEARDITLLDPCMGSGHILVYAFDLLARMYEEEGYQTKEIPTLILENNLYGMDIDRRCYQLAALALTMKARAYYSRYLRRQPVQPHVIALQPIPQEVIETAGSWTAGSDIWQFENIDTIGSLLKVTEAEAEAIHVDEGIFGQDQQILKTQAEYLARKYDCVVTNPPYLGKGKSDSLKMYLEKEYTDTKMDTMASFMEKCLWSCIDYGIISMINQQTWMFTVSYENLRHNILDNYYINTLVQLGPHAFDEISGEKVQSVTFTISKQKAKPYGIYFNVVSGKNCKAKELSFLAKENRYDFVDVTKFKELPGYRLSYWGSKKICETFTRNLSLSAVASPCVGLQTADNDRFLRAWFEVSRNRIGFARNNSASADDFFQKWYPYNKGGSAIRWYGNHELVVNWENDGSEIKKYKGAVVRNPSYYFRPCISWGLISGPLFRYFPAGFIFDVQGMSCFFETEEEIFEELSWMNTKVFNEVSKIISPSGHIQIGEIGDMPSIGNNADSSKTLLAKECVNISKQDWDAHETSWDFQENEVIKLVKELGPARAAWEDEPAQPVPMLIETYVGRYKSLWEGRFRQLHANEEELNRRFIEIYGLQDELSPDVPLDEVTILQKGEISIVDGEIKWHDDVIIKQLISYLVGCFMGRYSVDRAGLIIASQHTDLASLGLEVDGIDNGVTSTIAIDDDGIVPIVEEPDFFADDMAQRIELSIRRIFGDRSHRDNMAYIARQLGTDLRTYIYRSLYDDHVQMYQRRPIYWLFSSKMGDKKKKGYFKALVYMHRMESDTLSKLHADYVHPYIEKIERQLAEAEDQAMRDDLPQAQRNRARKEAETLRDKVREVRAFEQELVKLASHRISIDLDDGVKSNYPKFYPLVEPIKGIE